MTPLDRWAFDVTRQAMLRAWERCVRDGDPDELQAEIEATGRAMAQIAVVRNMPAAAAPVVVREGAG